MVPLESFRREGVHEGRASLAVFSTPSLSSRNPAFKIKWSEGVCYLKCFTVDKAFVETHACLVDVFVANYLLLEGNTFDRITSLNGLRSRLSCPTISFSDRKVLGLQFRFGDKSLRIRLVCPQNETAVLKGIRAEEDEGDGWAMILWRTMSFDFANGIIVLGVGSPRCTHLISEFRARYFGLSQWTPLQIARDQIISQRTPFSEKMLIFVSRRYVHVCAGG